MASVTTSRPSTLVRGNASMDSIRELSKGLKVEAHFCPPDVADPFDTVQWELRSAQIKDENGKLMFEQKDAEIPASWSQLATNVVVSKYFYGENGTGERERSVLRSVPVPLPNLKSMASLRASSMMSSMLSSTC